MAEYTLSNGYVLTDEEIEALCEKWESGEWEGPLVAVRAGRPPIWGESTSNLSFKCPATAVTLIERAAAKLGTTKSAFMRDAAIEKAANVLTARSV